MHKTAVATDKAPAAIGPYSQAIRADRFLFTSGQLGLDPATGALPEGVRAQADQALKNLAAILAAAGARPEDVVKTTVFLKDMGDFAAVNEIYGSFFVGTPPARSCVEVARLPKDALVEVEAVALIPG